MGIINLSEDSFYSESSFSNIEIAFKTAIQMVEDGADFIDLGAESTRPGSFPISAENEIEILKPFLNKIETSISVPLSVDTYKAEVAEFVLNHGATWINDITGLRDPNMASIISRYKAGVILMHMRGNPSNMQESINYKDCIKEIRAFLQEKIEFAESIGIEPNKIIIDPGIGFGKTAENNLELISNLEYFNELNKPLLLGISRKSFIGKVLNVPVEDRMVGSLISGLVGVLKGAKILRVHDVKETVHMLKMVKALSAWER